jgi:hypothetical protein
MRRINARATTGSPRSHNLNVRLPIDLFERLRLTATRERNGISSVARRLLALALEEQQGGAEDGRVRGSKHVPVAQGARGRRACPCGYAYDLFRNSREKIAGCDCRREAVLSTACGMGGRLA